MSERIHGWDVHIDGDEDYIERITGTRRNNVELCEDFLEVEEEWTGYNGYMATVRVPVDLLLRMMRQRGWEVRKCQDK